MKYLLWSGILLGGIIIGFFIGRSVNEEKPEVTITKEQPTEFITEYIRDTVVQKERVEVPVLNDTIVENDSIADSVFYSPDTVNIAEVPDTTLGDDLTIRREKVIKKITLPVIYLSEPEEKDTLIKEMLGIEEKPVKSVVVEFWESPLNFSGYKLSRKKLVVYGLSPQHDYSFYRKENDYYLSDQKVYYQLKQTQDFLKYVEVSKDVVFND